MNTMKEMVGRTVVRRKADDGWLYLGYREEWCMDDPPDAYEGDENPRVWRASILEAFPYEVIDGDYAVAEELCRYPGYQVEAVEFFQALLTDPAALHLLQKEDAT